MEKKTRIQKCKKNKTVQVNMRISARLKEECTKRAAEMDMSLTEFLTEGAVHMLENNLSERQRITIMVENQEHMKTAFSVLDSMKDSREVKQLRNILGNILRGEEMAWQV